MLRGCKEILCSSNSWSLWLADRCCYDNWERKVACCGCENIKSDWNSAGSHCRIKKPLVCSSKCGAYYILIYYLIFASLCFVYFRFLKILLIECVCMCMCVFVCFCLFVRTRWWIFVYKYTWGVSCYLESPAQWYIFIVLLLFYLLRDCFQQNVPWMTVLSKISLECRTQPEYTVDASMNEVLWRLLL